MSGLGGGSEEDDVLDLMEIVVLLLIPTFLKAAATDTTEETEATQDETEPSNTQKPAKVLPEGVTGTPPGMLDYVLKMILHDVTGDRKPKPLTTELIKQILVAYGEYDMANDKALIEEMFEAATENSSKLDTLPDERNDKQEKCNDTTPLLDLKSFTEALTHDIKLYDILNEVKNSTFFDDVFVTDESIKQKEDAIYLTTSDIEMAQAHEEAQKMREKYAVSEPLEKKSTLPAIDITAETYHSKALIVALWATVLITFFGYFWGVVPGSIFDCSNLTFGHALGCNIGNSVFHWVIFFAAMSLFGITCIVIGSVGNEVNCREPWKPFFGFCFTFSLVTMLFGLLYTSAMDSEWIEAYFASLVLGLVASLLHLSRAISMVVGPEKIEHFLSYFPMLSPLLSHSKSAEMNVKQAAARKLGAMTVNALEVFKVKEDNVLSTHYGKYLCVCCKNIRFLFFLMPG